MYDFTKVYKFTSEGANSNKVNLRRWEALPTSPWPLLGEPFYLHIHIDLEVFGGSILHDEVILHICSSRVITQVKENSVKLRQGSVQLQGHPKARQLTLLITGPEPILMQEK